MDLTIITEAYMAVMGEPIYLSILLSFIFAAVLARYTENALIFVVMGIPFLVIMTITASNFLPTGTLLIGLLIGGVIIGLALNAIRK